MWPFAIGAGLFIGYSLLRKKNAAGTINFYPDRVTDFKFEGLTPVFVLGLTVHNTSNQNFTVNSMAGDAFSNNYQVGTLYNFTPQTIAKNSQSVLYVNVKLKLNNIVNDLIRAFQNGNFQQTLVLKGFTNVDNLQIPIDLTYKIPGDVWT